MFKKFLERIILFVRNRVKFFIRRNFNLEN
jgi:hypothetical protein